MKKSPVDFVSQSLQGNHFLVRPARFERATLGLEVRRTKPCNPLIQKLLAPFSSLNLLIICFQYFQAFHAGSRKLLHPICTQTNPPFFWANSFTTAFVIKWFYTIGTNPFYNTTNGSWSKGDRQTRMNISVYFFISGFHFLKLRCPKGQRLSGHPAPIRYSVYRK